MTDSYQVIFLSQGKKGGGAGEKEKIRGGGKEDSIGVNMDPAPRRGGGGCDIGGDWSAMPGGNKKRWLRNNRKKGLPPTKWGTQGIQGRTNGTEQITSSRSQKKKKRKNTT